MIPNEGITEVVGKMVARQNAASARAPADRYGMDSSQPYVLFLGAACGRAAGVPSIADMARSVFESLIEIAPDMFSKYAKKEYLQDDDIVTDKFYQMLEDMSSLERRNLLRSFFEDLPVPLFYQDLARLVHASFFRIILTTNCDTLLEKALSGLGSSAGVPFRTINLGAKQQLSVDPDIVPDLVTVIKLHGDISQGNRLMITPDEIEQALRCHRSFVKGELAQDMVIVGYEFESPPINDWLWRSRQEIWWASPELPNNEHMGRIMNDREAHFIEGEAAKPELFFGQLALRLLTLPSSDKTRPSDVSEISIPYSQPISVEALVSDPDMLRPLYIADQLERAKEQLNRLESDIAADRSNAQLQAQIAYQRTEVATLEDELRTLSPNRPRLTEAVDRIVQAVHRATLDPNTQAYLDTQAQLIRDETSRSNPNQDILSAAISATLVVSERLGEKVISQELVRNLSAFAPSLARRL